MKILTAEAMKLTDKRTMEDEHVTELDLVRRAAAAICKTISEEIRPDLAAKIAIVCGNSNNASDGFALAGLLLDAGYENTMVYHISNPDNMKSTCRFFYEGFRAEFPDHFTAPESKDALRTTLAQADYIVDAVVGVGLSGLLRADNVAVAECINESPAKVISLDIPTGLDSNTGSYDPICVKADYTIVISSLKCGHVLADGPDCCGQMFIADIGLNDYDDVESMTVIEEGFLQGALPRRCNNTNKYDFGSVLVIGSNVSMAGAGLMCAMSALKSGSGLVTLACPEENFGVVSVKAPLELMVKPLKSDLSNLDQLLEKKSTVVFGPGLGRDERFLAVLGTLIGQELNLIVDADGLWYLAKIANLKEKLRANLILTPHLGEASTLLKTDVKNIKRDLRASARKLAADYNAWAVLKGHNTLVAEPGGSLYVSLAGNSGMATAGSGDVLAGIMAGITGKAPDLKKVCLAVWLHGTAGDLAMEEFGRLSMTATDIMAFIGKAAAKAGIE